MQPLLGREFVSDFSLHIGYVNTLLFSLGLQIRDCKSTELCETSRHSSRRGVKIHTSVAIFGSSITSCDL